MVVYQWLDNYGTAIQTLNEVNFHPNFETIDYDEVVALRDRAANQR